MNSTSEQWEHGRRYMQGWQSSRVKEVSYLDLEFED